MFIIIDTLIFPNAKEVMAINKSRTQVTETTDPQCQYRSELVTIAGTVIRQPLSICDKSPKAKW